MRVGIPCVCSVSVCAPCAPHVLCSTVGVCCGVCVLHVGACTPMHVCAPCSACSALCTYVLYVLHVCCATVGACCGCASWLHVFRLGVCVLYTCVVHVSVCSMRSMLCSTAGACQGCMCCAVLQTLHVPHPCCALPLVLTPAADTALNPGLFYSR